MAPLVRNTAWRIQLLSLPGPFKNNHPNYDDTGTDTRNRISSPDLSMSSSEAEMEEAVEAWLSRLPKQNIWYRY